MLYRIKAQPNWKQLSNFWTILNDGTVSKQEPDGTEICASMKRAVISGDKVEWYETCYCSPPLKHERATIYDKFFTGIQIEPISSAPELRGRDFWKHLETLRQRRGSPLRRPMAAPELSDEGKSQL